MKKIAIISLLLLVCPLIRAIEYTVDKVPNVHLDDGRRFVSNPDGSGDTNTLYKMKDLWTFLSRSFESPDKYVKKIRKATDASDYKLAVNALFRECALK